MARVILSEYAAKKLFLGEEYLGISFDHSSPEVNLISGTWVVKIDDGTKKRNKLGLVKVGLSAAEAGKQVAAFLDQGFTRVLVEPMIPHGTQEEQYVSFDLTRRGVDVLYNESGGNDIEAQAEKIIRATITRSDFLTGAHFVHQHIPSGVVQRAVEFMKKHHVSFLEINPFVISGEVFHCLDLAIELDSAKSHSLPSWVQGHIQSSGSSTEAEEAVKELDSESTAAFALTVFNKNASVFTLLSGGGASLVVLDELVACGHQAAVANYGEYSGAPSREETKRYTEELLKLLFASTAKNKILLIAGGVANFTDITTTFAGIIDACTNFVDDFIKQSVTVVVRRGGPRQAYALKMLEDFFSTHAINATVSGPQMTLSEVVAVVGKKLS